MAVESSVGLDCRAPQQISSPQRVAIDWIYPSRAMWDILMGSCELVMRAHSHAHEREEESLDEMELPALPEDGGTSTALRLLLPSRRGFRTQIEKHMAEGAYKCQVETEARKAALHPTHQSTVNNCPGAPRKLRPKEILDEYLDFSQIKTKAQGEASRDAAKESVQHHQLMCAKRQAAKEERNRQRLGLERQYRLEMLKNLSPWRKHQRYRKNRTWGARLRIRRQPGTSHIANRRVCPRVCHVMCRICSARRVVW